MLENDGVKEYGIPDLFDLRQSTAPPNRQNGTLQTERAARCHQATCPQRPLVLGQKDGPLRGNRDNSAPSPAWVNKPVIAEAVRQFL